LLIFFSLVIVILALVACESKGTGQGQAPVILNADSVSQRRLPVSALSQDMLRDLAKNNPCYLPLLEDSSLYEKGKRVGFKFEDLYNARLPQGHVYRARYLVGDFNVLDEFGAVKGVEEVYPRIACLMEFQHLDSALIDMIERAGSDVNLASEVIARLQNSGMPGWEMLVNFLNKVWRYRTPPLARRYGISGNDVYAAGQRLCMCEAREDTLLFLGQFAVSGKRQSPGGGKMHESLPTGTRRHYYGGRYYISSKNWERERKYEALDVARDQEVGGGNNQVTYYKGKAELPNFMLLEPAEDYPGAMTSNGIHEVALSELSRGMLGAPNSIGCIRVTDFGSKFLRWWTPQDCSLFILYSNDRYVRKMDELNAGDLRPFRNQKEGDRFRYWINTFLPEQARYMEVDLEGDYMSEYLIDAYIAHRDAYLNWLEKQ
jgi:hypothetical protein